MALGGGSFTAQNKALPGTYINFVSASNATSVLSDRGIATMALPLNWGPDHEVFTVTNERFRTNCLTIFGYEIGSDEMQLLRELMQHTRIAHLYKLTSGGQKASNIFATAKYSGTRGNAIKVVVRQNEAYTAETPVYDVSTYLETTCVDVQEGVSSIADLEDNDFVVWLPGATLELSAGAVMTGGTNGTATNAAYEEYLRKIESYAFNTMGCISTDATVKALFTNFTRRLREECGLKFQTVLFRHAADYEGVISVENGLVSAADDPSLVCWVTGAEAGCEVSGSLTNSTYDGELSVNTDFTQAQLANGIAAGKLMLHKVYDDVNVLSDINTLLTLTDEKGADFKSNQTIRVLDQIATDIAVLFGTKYIGKIPNDDAGRTSLWADIVEHHENLQAIRAIEEFDSEHVTVEAGESKGAVVVRDTVTPTNAMEQLYMTVIVE